MTKSKKRLVAGLAAAAVLAVAALYVFSVSTYNELWKACDYSLSWPVSVSDYTLAKALVERRLRPPEKITRAKVISSTEIVFGTLDHNYGPMGMGGTRYVVQKMQGHWVIATTSYWVT